MSASLLRSSVIALVGFAFVAATRQPVSREQFIRAYVLCNNKTWADTSHALIPFVRGTGAHGDVGTRSPAVLGFVGFGYLLGARALDRPQGAATLGWAAAVKAYADEGGIESRFRSPVLAHAYLRRAGGLETHDLDGRETSALATNLHLSLLARHGRAWALAGMTRMPLDSTLDRGTAVALLRTIGSHESVGSAKVIALETRRCDEADVRAFLSDDSK